ncbi:MAG: methyl-accepting chemotaxis protein, partial [Caryophanon sp.]|nr:methyl-accepting chemotaxis protein [Caryophanon sp.]
LEEVRERAEKIAKEGDFVVHDIRQVEDISEKSRKMLATASSATEEQLCSLEEISATAEALESIVDELLAEIKIFKTN